MDNLKRSLQRLDRDRIFWLIVGGLVLVYVFTSWGSVLPFILRLAAIVLAITVHECAHAWAADRLGDPTARLMGRVSLNPLRHLDPLGSVMMLLTTLTGLGIGWGKPTPITPYRLRYGARRGRALVSLAGPLSNLLLAAIAGLPLRFLNLGGAASAYIYLVLNSLVVTNLILAFFNLLPIPPLDGYSALVGLLDLLRANWSWSIIRFLESLEQYGFMILFGLVIVSQLMPFDLLGLLIQPPAALFYHWIVGA